MIELKYWRDLSKKERAILKDKHSIKVVTFDFICMVYSNKKDSPIPKATSN